MNEIDKRMINSTPGMKTVTIPVTGGPFVDFNPKRVSLVISNHGASNVFIAWGTGAAISFGINLPVQSNPLVLTERDHGALVKGPITAIPDGAQQGMTYAEATTNEP